MTLEAIYYIGQTVAVIAILGSLIALILQMRQANRLSRQASVRSHIEGLQNISRVLTDIPDMAGVWFRGRDGLSHMNNEDRLRYIAFISYALRVWEGLYTEYTSDLLNKDLWLAHAQQLRDFLVITGAQEVWALREHLFSKEFREYIDCNIDFDEALDIFGFNTLDGASHQEGTPP